MYLYNLILKGFIPKLHPLIKYISIQKVLVLNKNKVLKYWKIVLMRVPIPILPHFKSLSAPVDIYSVYVNDWEV